MNRTGKGAAIALLCALLAGGCQRSHPRNSSGSNWLTCETLADCRAEPDAVTCDAEGFCADEDGHRFPVAVDGGGPTGGRDSGPQPPTPTTDCAWGVDALLAEAGASAPGRTSCGNYNIGVSEDAAVSAAMNCFADALRDAKPVQVTFNRCFDCSIPTTYVATSSGELFAVLMAQDIYGAEQEREVRVEACASIDLDPVAPEATCQRPVELYSCREPLGEPKEPPPGPPVQPLKLGDVPVPLGESGVPLHLFISNQSFETARVDIDVYIDGTHVVTGDFDVGSQHNWILFDLTVPAGTLPVRAASQRGDAELEQPIDVPAERWVVIDYWYYSDDMLGRYFDLTLHEQPPGFD